MIVILKQNAEQNEVNALLKQLEEMGFDHHYSKGENSAIVGIIGDTSTLESKTIKNAYRFKSHLDSTSLSVYAIP